MHMIVMIKRCWSFSVGTVIYLRFMHLTRHGVLIRTKRLVDALVDGLKVARERRGETGALTSSHIAVVAKHRRIAGGETSSRLGPRVSSSPDQRRSHLNNDGATSLMSGLSIWGTPSLKDANISSKGSDANASSAPAELAPAPSGGQGNTRAAESCEILQAAHLTASVDESKKRLETLMREKYEIHLQKETESLRLQTDTLKQQVSLKMCCSVFNTLVM